MSYLVKVNEADVICETSKQVFDVIKKFSDNETFWDDVINDEVGEDFYAFGKFYRPADVLKAVDRKQFEELCVMFWDECEQDVVDEINDISVNEIRTIYGFEVHRCSI